MQVEGRASVRTGLLWCSGDTEAVAQTYGLALRCLQSTPLLLVRDSVVVHYGVELQPADTFGTGVVQHPPCFPPGFLSVEDHKGHINI